MQAAHHTATGPLMLALRRVVHPYEAQYQGMKHLPRLQNDHSQPRHRVQRTPQTESQYQGPRHLPGLPLCHSDPRDVSGYSVQSTPTLHPRKMPVGEKPR